MSHRNNKLAFEVNAEVFCDVRHIFNYENKTNKHTIMLF